MMTLRQVLHCLVALSLIFDPLLVLTVAHATDDSKPNRGSKPTVSPKASAPQGAPKEVRVHRYRIDPSKTRSGEAEFVDFVVPRSDPKKLAEFQPSRFAQSQMAQRIRKGHYGFAQDPGVARWAKTQAKDLGHFVAIGLPRETALFYAVHGMYSVRRLITNNAENPAAIQHFLDHITDPVGLLAFSSFVATNRATGKLMNQLLNVMNKWKRASLRSALRGVPPGASSGASPPPPTRAARIRSGQVGAGTKMKVLSAQALKQSALRMVRPLIGPLGMSAGMMASLVTEEYFHDPHIQTCHELSEKAQRTDEEERKRLDACDRAYWEWTVGEKFWQYEPQLIGLVIAGFISHRIGAKVLQLVKSGAAWATENGELIARANQAGQKVPVATQSGQLLRGSGQGLHWANSARTASGRIVRRITVGGVRLVLNNLSKLTTFGWFMFMFNVYLFMEANGYLDHWFIRPHLTTPRYANRLLEEVNDLYAHLGRLEKNLWNKVNQPPPECSLESPNFNLTHHPGVPTHHFDQWKAKCEKDFKDFVTTLKEHSYLMDKYRVHLIQPARQSFIGWSDAVEHFLGTYISASNFYRELAGHLSLEREYNQKRHQLKQKPRNELSAAELKIVDTPYTSSLDLRDPLFGVHFATEIPLEEVQIQAEDSPEVQAEKRQTYFRQKFKRVNDVRLFIDDYIRRHPQLPQVDEVKKFVSQGLLDAHKAKQPLSAADRKDFISNLVEIRDDIQIEMPKRYRLSLHQLHAQGQWGEFGLPDEITLLLDIREGLLAADLETPLKSIFQRPHPWLTPAPESELPETYKTLSREYAQRAAILQKTFARLNEILWTEHSAFYSSVGLHSEKWPKLKAQKFAGKNWWRGNIFLEVARRLGQPEAVPPGVAYLRTLNEDAEIIDQGRKHDHPKTLGFAQTPSMTDYLLASMACGPDITNHHKISDPSRGLSQVDWKEFVLTMKWGFQIDFNPPKIINYPQDVCRAQMPDNLDQIADRRQHNGVVSPSRRRDFNIHRALWTNPDHPKSPFKGLLDLVKKTIDPQFLGFVELEHADGRRLKTTAMDIIWFENVDQAVLAQFKQFEAEYLEFIEDYFFSVLEDPSYLDKMAAFENVELQGHTVAHGGLGVSTDYFERAETDTMEAYPYVRKMAKGLRNSIKDELTFYLDILLRIAKSRHAGQAPNTGYLQQLQQRFLEVAQRLRGNYLDLTRSIGTKDQRQQAFTDLAKQTRTSLGGLFYLVAEGDLELPVLEQQFSDDEISQYLLKFEGENNYQSQVALVAFQRLQQILAEVYGYQVIVNAIPQEHRLSGAIE